MSLEQEMRQDVKEIRADISEMRTDIALIKASLETKKEDKKIKATLLVAFIGFLGGLLSTAISALLGN